MSLLRFSLIFVALTTLTALSAAASQTPREQKGTAQFPVVSAYNLAKEKVTLPQDFSSPLNLLVLSFGSEQQQQVESWTPVIPDVQKSHPNLSRYLLHVFPRQNWIYRWWQNSALRSNNASTTWKWNIALYVEKNQFRKSLQLGEDQDITVLLVDKAGHVLWKTSGASTPAKIAALNSALSAAGSAH